MEQVLLVLDLDGPILDVRTRYQAAHERALAEAFGAAPRLSWEDFWYCKRERRSLETLLRMEGVEVDARVERYKRSWLAWIEADELLALDKIQPDAREAVMALHRSVGRALVSMRSRPEGAAQTLARLNVRDLFDSVIFVSHAIKSKAPAFRTLLGDRQPCRAAAVGDTEVDYQAAEDVGISFVGVSCGIRSEAQLREAGASVIARDLAEAIPIALDELWAKSVSR
jgi:phosphoglycolate phosphatase-like HAD superfamily hydrolase